MNSKLWPWLTPGIGIKRWVLLVMAAAFLIVLGLFILLGQDLVREVYYRLALTENRSLLVSVALLLMGVGFLGIAFGVQRALRSIVRGISAEAVGRTGEILYEQRLLKRGPKIVAVGGGTGLPSLLRGLKAYTSNITAIVTTMDDGGSSGRLRREHNMLAPGDIRNNLIALAEDESSIAQLFQHRFASNEKSSLNGHSLGNLVLAGLQEMSGSFDQAIEELSSILKTQGRVLPTTVDEAELCAEMEDGTVVRGESMIPESQKRIKRVFLDKEHVKLYPKARISIQEADIIILGPGSLFTSIIPNLLVTGLAHEIEASPAKKIYVTNLMTQPGETDGFGLEDHLKALERYIDLSTFDYVIMNSEKVPETLAKRYKDEGQYPVVNDIKEPNKYGLEIVAAKLLDIVEFEGKPTIKHHSRRLAAVIARSAREEFQNSIKSRFF
jgi:uncharacterized cofD-like protein